MNCTKNCVSELIHGNVCFRTVASFNGIDINVCQCTSLFDVNETQLDLFESLKLFKNEFCWIWDVANPIGTDICNRMLIAQG
jgi:hypothetical protein